jgi:Icc-related predicted phosphoesterase
MRLLAVGDLHGDTAPLLRLLDSEVPDGLLCVGDWGDPGQIDAATWDAVLERVPTLTVFGNHDDLELLPTLRNRDGSAVLLGQGERRDFLGLTVAGVSGIWAKSHRLPHYVTDEDVAGWATALARAGAVDILLTHGCPLGVADRTPSGRPGGQRFFLELLKTVRPRVYLCGHLHVAQRKDLTDPRCAVLNTGALSSGRYVTLHIAEGRVIRAENSALPPAVTLDGPLPP